MDTSIWLTVTKVLTAGKQTLNSPMTQNDWSRHCLDISGFVKMDHFKGFHHECVCRTRSYQVDVDFGVAQGSSTSITGHHSGLNLSHWLLCHQFDGKVLVHLDTNNVLTKIRHCEIVMMCVTDVLMTKPLLCVYHLLTHPVLNGLSSEHEMFSTLKNMCAER